MQGHSRTLKGSSRSSPKEEIKYKLNVSFSKQNTLSTLIEKGKDKEHRGKIRGLN